MNPLLGRVSKVSVVVAIVAIALGVNVIASSASEIEGVWSFDHGSVAITAQSNGTFEGTVVSETTFGECPHAVGEVMWTGMSEQSDGSFWGFHQWFVKNEAEQCEHDPRGLGPTAWRVLENPQGAHYLKVCFSHPGTSQPKIAADGSDAEATYGCEDSTLIAPVPSTTGGTLAFAQVIGLPSACTAGRRLRIRLKDPKYDPLKKVVVKLNGKKALTVKGVKRLRRKAITLTKLPGGRFKLGVTATTVLNQRLRGSRTYSGCGSKPEHVKLHKVKHHA
ncbi:MAG TPA: hypothetical protein VL979_13660 [Solirubrobacteraceae bacterium]|nr:hypothetical protein [Solirubrobacteraceae bacterium]